MKTATFAAERYALLPFLEPLEEEDWLVSRPALQPLKTSEEADWTFGLLGNDAEEPGAGRPRSDVEAE